MRIALAAEVHHQLDDRAHPNAGQLQAGHDLARIGGRLLRDRLRPVQGPGDGFEDHLRIRGLGDHVIHARRLGDGLRLHLLIARRIEDDRYVGQIAIGPDGVRERTPVQSRHDHVGDDEVRFPLARCMQRFDTVGGLADFMAVIAQKCHEKVSIEWAIVGNQNERH